MNDSREDTGQSRPRREQVPLHSLGQCAAALLNAVSRGANREVASHGLTSMEFALIRLFLTDEEWTATELSQVLPVEVSAISRMVNKLVERGLLSRRRPKNDRRIVLLRLTQEGIELGLELHQWVHEYESRLTAGIDEGEIDALQSIVRRILINSSAIGRS